MKFSLEVSVFMFLYTRWRSAFRTSGYGLKQRGKPAVPLGPGRPPRPLLPPAQHFVSESPARSAVSFSPGQKVQISLLKKLNKQQKSKITFFDLPVPPRGAPPSVSPLLGHVSAAPPLSSLSAHFPTTRRLCRRPRRPRSHGERAVAPHRATPPTTRLLPRAPRAHTPGVAAGARAPFLRSVSLPPASSEARAQAVSSHAALSARARPPRPGLPSPRHPGLCQPPLGRHVADVSVLSHL